MGGSRPEAEARIVVGMAEHDHEGIATFAQQAESVLDQGRTDALALAIRGDGHGREAHAGELVAIMIDGHRGEEDVAGDVALVFGNK